MKTLALRRVPTPTLDALLMALEGIGRIRASEDIELAVCELDQLDAQAIAVIERVVLVCDAEVRRRAAGV